jgi:hypothetical protein
MRKGSWAVVMWLRYCMNDDAQKEIVRVFDHPDYFKDTNCRSGYFMENWTVKRWTASSPVNTV